MGPDGSFSGATATRSSRSLRLAMVDSAFSRMETTLAPRWRTTRRRELISSASPLRENPITTSWPVTAVL